MKICNVVKVYDVSYWILPNNGIELRKRLFLSIILFLEIEKWKENIDDLVIGSVESLKNLYFYFAFKYKHGTSYRHQKRDSL